MHVAVTGRQRGGESGIQSVVVEDPDERLIQRENADGQCGGRSGETGLYFAGKRHALALPGTNRLYRRMWNSAAQPSRQVIFFPSAYVRPL